MASQDLRRDGSVDTEPVEQGRPRAKVVGGRFVIERLIARGGMGAVYLAHQLNLGRPVALKIMTPPPDGETSDSFEERFRLEAETLASLHHPHIVTVYDYGPTDDGRYYIALEYIDGPRFTDLIRKGRLAPERVLRLTLQVCQALAYAHRRGVVHRDLKPSNLMVRVEDGVETVKVVDFGLVKVLEADHALTRAGLVLGSPHCMSPEQVRGDEIDGRADIYAIGILLFRSLTGAWPFHAETVAGTMIAHVQNPRPSFQSVAPDLMVPAGLEAIVLRCMAREPSERFQEVGPLAEALTACLAVPEDRFLSVSSYHTAQPTGPALNPPTSPRRAAWLPLAAAVLALTVLVALLLWRPWQLTPPVAHPAAPAPAASAPPAARAEEAAEDPASGTLEELAGVPAIPVPTPSPAPTAAPSATPSAAAPAGPARPSPPTGEPGEAEAPTGYMPLPDDFQ